jgi:hypothetical protein
MPISEVPNSTRFCLARPPDKTQRRCYDKENRWEFVENSGKIGRKFVENTLKIRRYLKPNPLIVRENPENSKSGDKILRAQVHAIIGEISPNFQSEFPGNFCTKSDRNSWWNWSICDKIGRERRSETRINPYCTGEISSKFHDLQLICTERRSTIWRWRVPSRDQIFPQGVFRYFCLVVVWHFDMFSCIKFPWIFHEFSTIIQVKNRYWRLRPKNVVSGSLLSLLFPLKQESFWKKWSQMWSNSSATRTSFPKVSCRRITLTWGAKNNSMYRSRTDRSHPKRGQASGR